MRHPEFSVEPIYKMSEALINQLLSGHDEKFVSEVEKCLEENMRRYCGLNQSLGQFFAFFFVNLKLLMFKHQGYYKVVQTANSNLHKRFFF